MPESHVRLWMMNAFTATANRTLISVRTCPFIAFCDPTSERSVYRVVEMDFPQGIKLAILLFPGAL